MVYAKIVETEKEYEDAIFIRRKVFVEEQDVPLHLELDEYDQEAIHFVAYDEETPFGAGRIQNHRTQYRESRTCMYSSKLSRKKVR